MWIQPELQPPTFPQSFSPFLFFASSTPADHSWHWYVWYYIHGVVQSLSFSLSLSPPLLSWVSLSESPLIPPSIVPPSPPITQNQEKHTPTRDWGSDKIKNTRRLIWITGARGIGIVRDSEPDAEAEGETDWGGVERKESYLKKNKDWKNDKEKVEHTRHREGLDDLFIIHQKTSCWNPIFFLYFLTIVLPII